MTEATKNATLNTGDHAEMTLIPLSCNSAGRSAYSPFKKQWHVHFEDEQKHQFYLLTTSDAIVKQAGENVNKCVKAKFIVAGIDDFGNCVRIKNVKFQD